MTTKTYAKKDHSDLIEKLANGIKELTTSDKWTEYLKVQSAFHNYSAKNALLILAQCPEASRVAGYNTWKSLGRQVKKGEKGIYILAPLVTKVETGEGQSDKQVFGFRYVSVFDISQTDGEDLPDITNKIEGDDVDGAFTKLVEVATTLGFTVADHEFVDGVNGDCSHNDMHIRIEVKNSPAQRVKTLAHELAHAILHAPSDVDYRSNRGLCELEAESVAFVVCHSIGIDSGDYSFGYVAGWAGNGDEAVKAISQSQSRIQKAAASILKAFETTEKNLTK
jgi:antirestriction protein ArdC